MAGRRHDRRDGDARAARRPGARSPAAAAGVSGARPRRAGSQPRSRTTAARDRGAGRASRSPRCAATARAVFNAAAGAALTPEQFMDAIVFEPEPGALEAVGAPAGPRPLALRRLELGLRPRRSARGARPGAPSSPRPRPARQSPTRAIFRRRTRAARRRSPAGRSTSATRRRTSRARAPPGMRFAPAPLRGRCW